MLIVSVRPIGASQHAGNYRVFASRNSLWPPEAVPCIPPSFGHPSFGPSFQPRWSTAMEPRERRAAIEASAKGYNNTRAHLLRPLQIGQLVRVQDTITKLWTYGIESARSSESAITSRRAVVPSGGATGGNTTPAATIQRPSSQASTCPTLTAPSRTQETRNPAPGQTLISHRRSNRMTLSDWRTGSYRSFVEATAQEKLLPASTSNTLC